MTLHRRPLGRGRWMAALGGVLMVVGSVLPWWHVGGTPGITAESGNGLAGSGILVFLVGIATLALLALPYAAGDRPLGLDRIHQKFGVISTQQMRLMGLEITAHMALLLACGTKVGIGLGIPIPFQTQFAECDVVGIPFDLERVA